MKSIITAALVLATTLTFTACEEKKKQDGTTPTPTAPEEEASGSTLTDPRDNKTYKTVKIGTQTWMAENLNYEAKGSKCYDNNPANCKKYGMLYNWYTAKTACPDGWHLPSDTEWQTLVDFAGGDETAGKILKASNGWNDNYGKSGNGEDKFGFSALPSGLGNPNNFYDVGNYGYWWSSSEYGSSNRAYHRHMGYSYENVYNRNHIGKDFLFSVRCVQGDAKEAAAKEAAIKAESAAKIETLKTKAKKGSFSDSRDSKTYKTVKLNNQTWLAENLNYNADGSECYDNQESNCQKYGRLYNWSAAKSACPSGWHLPSNEEWQTLVNFVGGDKTAGNMLKTSSGWNEDGNGVDAVGFSALPGGFSGMESEDGPGYYLAGERSQWWSANEDSSDSAYDWSISSGEEAIYYGSIGKDYLFSVRCIMD